MIRFKLWQLRLLLRRLLARVGVWPIKKHKRVEFAPAAIESWDGRLDVKALEGFPRIYGAAVLIRDSGEFRRVVAYTVPPFDVKRENELAGVNRCAETGQLGTCVHAHWQTEVPIEVYGFELFGALGEIIGRRRAMKPEEGTHFTMYPEDRLHIHWRADCIARRESKVERRCYNVTEAKYVPAT